MSRFSDAADGHLGKSNFGNYFWTVFQQEVVICMSLERGKTRQEYQTE